MRSNHWLVHMLDRLKCVILISYLVLRWNLEFQIPYLMNIYDR